MYDVNKETHRKQQNGFAVAGLLMVTSICGFSIALKAYLLVTNLDSGAFWPHATLFLGSLLCLIGVGLKDDGSTCMVAGIVFNVFGIFMCFCGAIVDGVQAGHISDTEFTKCKYSNSSGAVTCSYYSLWQAILKGTAYCKLKFTSNSCYCCYIYKETVCKGTAPIPTYYSGVESCSQVEGEYQDLLWTSMGFCCANFVLAIVTSALVNQYRSAVKYRIMPFEPSYTGMAAPAAPMSRGPFVIYNPDMPPHSNLYPMQPMRPIDPPAYEDIAGPGPSRGMPPPGPSRGMPPGPSGGRHDPDLHPPPGGMPMPAPGYGRDTDDGPENPTDDTKWHHVREKPPPYSH